jgi:2-polyprenyl-3-methyl-5-hydroxy-6-metoxy-1,4-benzoquinol methylase
MIERKSKNNSLLRKRLIQEYFDTTSYSSFSNSSHYECSALSIHRKLSGWLPQKGQSVLDIGCGGGELLYLFKKSGIHDLTGVNLCEAELKKAKEKIDAKFYCQNVLDFFYDNQRKYDWIYALNFIEHLDDDELLQVMNQASLHLKPTGNIVVIIPNALSPFAGQTRYWDLTHQRSFTPSSLRQLSKLCNLSDNLEFKECGPKPHGVKSSIRWLAWQVLRGLIAVYLLIEVADIRHGIYTSDMVVRFHAKELI